MTRNSFCFFYLIIFLFVSGCQPVKSQKELGATGKEAMVVTAHPIATKIGVDVLKNDGNAIDAAIATQFALAVVYPRAGNIGGGGFAVIRSKDGQADCLDFREKAPLAAHKDMYLDESGEVIPLLSQRGHLGAGVPGSVAGMWTLHKKYGSRPWAELIQPAINVAFDGFIITQNEADALNEKQEDFIAANTHKPWAIKDSDWSAGDSVVQKDLSETLSLIRDLGRDGFYKGKTADRIVAEMETANGIISHEDLARYEPAWRTPLKGAYKDFTVIGMPPPSSGGVAVIQLLKGAEILSIGSYPHNSTQAAHLMAEVERRVFADRAKFIGDPDFYPVPGEELISYNYNSARFETIGLASATPSSEIEAGKIELEESEQTTHFSIVDPFGNAIAVTTTLNLNYGCKVWVKDAGFVLNNEMDDFSAKPGVPNFFGLVGAEANSIRPGKRMVSSMSPTIIEKNGKLKMVLGTPGGATIITSVFQSFLNVVEYDMTMQEAVNAKKIHHQWRPDEIKVEEGALDTRTIEELEAMGHKIKVREPIGRNDCILIHEDGIIEGGADYTRGDDFALGY